MSLDRHPNVTDKSQVARGAQKGTVTIEKEVAPPMTNLPASADPATAPLPERYEVAKTALKECHRVDECKDWADKAKALGSYARQADDDTLYKTAMRIQARAIRRSGELLQEFQTGSKGGRPRRNGTGAGTVSARSAPLGPSLKFL